MGTLTYFKLNVGVNEDPDEVEFYGHLSLKENIYQLTTGKPCVYLVCDGDECYATDDLDKAINFCTELNDVQVQEWESFEDAYAVMLHMNEGHPLAYNKSPGGSCSIKSAN